MGNGTEIKTDGFVEWSLSAMGKEKGSDFQLESAIESIALSAFADPEDPRTLDLESILTVVTKLMNKEKVDSEVLIVCRKLLQRVSKEFAVAAEILEAMI